MGVIEFIHEVSWNDLPDDVRHGARRCLLDTVGAAIAGRRTVLSQIVHDFAASAYGGQGTSLWLDGRAVSPCGAALANGMTIDALDIHDGYNRVKGHAGVALVPAALATLSLHRKGRVSGHELLATLVMGYEVALRAGLALHATARDYHTSGAWNALGCAAVTARRLGLGADQTRHALGIAEYHGPRSQMMRCIDHPTMLKDGSGWGAMAGVSAAQLGGGGFTGAPALTVESADVSHLWADLGGAWLIRDQYVKPYAVCRWAQPAVAGALALRRAHALAPNSIRRIRVHTFDPAIRLTCRRPVTTEEAQYSLPFPVAVALTHNRLSPMDLSGQALSDAQVLRLSRCVEIVADPIFTERFPDERWARIEIQTVTGAVLDSGDIQAEWETVPPSDEEVVRKFCRLASITVPDARAAALQAAIWHCADLEDAGTLQALLTPPAA